MVIFAAHAPKKMRKPIAIESRIPPPNARQPAMQRKMTPATSFTPGTMKPSAIATSPCLSTLHTGIQIAAEIAEPSRKPHSIHQSTLPVETGGVETGVAYGKSRGCCGGSGGGVGGWLISV